MQILNFIKKLLPRIERSHVAEDLRTTEKELTTIVIPCYQHAVEAFKVIKLESVESKAMSTEFYHNFNLRKAMKSLNFVSDINSRLKNFQANVVQIQSLLDTVLDKDIIREGLTVRSAFVLRAAGNMSFMSRYLLSLLNYIYMAEAAHRNAEVVEALQISKAEQNFVRVNFIRFTKLYSEYAINSEEFGRLLSSVPEVYVNDKTAAAAKALLEVNSDPLEKTGFSNFVGSPIYKVRLMFAQWQNDRYESAKAKKQQLELRLLYLENQKKQNNDPTIENEISRLQDRIERLDYRINETDDELGI